MSEYVDKLRSSVRKLKAATAESPIKFALLTGTPDPVLLLGNDATSKAIQDARKEVGARNTPLTGTCFTEEGTAIFSGLDAKALRDVKNALKLAGFTIPVDSHAPAPEESEEDTAPATVPAPPPPPAPKPVDPRIARIEAEVKSLNTRLAKADPKSSNAQGAKLKISEAGMAYRKGNLDQSEKLLKQADSLLPAK